MDSGKWYVGTSFLSRSITTPIWAQLILLLRLKISVITLKRNLQTSKLPLPTLHLLSSQIQLSHQVFSFHVSNLSVLKKSSLCGICQINRQQSIRFQSICWTGGYRAGTISDRIVLSLASTGLFSRYVQGCLHYTVVKEDKSRCHCRQVIPTHFQSVGAIQTPRAPSRNATYRLPEIC